EPRKGPGGVRLRLPVDRGGRQGVVAARGDVVGHGRAGGPGRADGGAVRRGRFLLPPNTSYASEASGTAGRLGPSRRAREGRLMVWQALRRIFTGTPAAHSSTPAAQAPPPRPNCTNCGAAVAPCHVTERNPRLEWAALHFCEPCFQR